MCDIRLNVVKAESEKLCLGFEVTQLKDQVDPCRNGACSMEGAALFGVQAKVDMALTFSKFRQAKQAVYLLGRKNGKAF